MSTATQPMSTHLTASTPAGDAPVIADPPRLAEGVELLGEFRNSGDSQPPSLVRRADGQVIQMSRLLYLVASRIDGSRDAPAIAELVSDDLGRPLNADQVRYVITAKLLPLGILATNGAPRTLPRANPLLALRARGTLLPERAANAVGMFFRPLFRWPVIVAVLVSVAAMDYWVFAVHGLTAGAQQVLRDPVGVVVVFALSVGLRPIPRVRARGGLPLRRRAVGQDRRRDLPGLAVVLHQRHRLVPAQPRRPAAHRPRRPVLRPDLHPGPGGSLRGHLVRDPAPRHRHYTLGDAGATAPVRSLRRLLHSQ